MDDLGLDLFEVDARRGVLDGPVVVAVAVAAPVFAYPALLDG